MRSCPNCGQKLALFSRNGFCSSTCSESFRREEARWWELSGVDGNTENGSAWDPKEEAEGDAAQFVWAGILATANYIRKRQPFLPQPRRNVVKLKEGSTEVPLYFIGGGLTELRLSQMMEVGRAIYAVEIPWPAAWRHAANKNETAILPDMETLAAAYTQALSTHLRSKRCVLAGISFYGLVAFEVARQLRSAGFNVEMVLLLDAQAIYLTLWQKLIKDLRNCRTPTLSDLRSLMGLLARSISPDARHPTAKLGDDGVPWQSAFIGRVYAKAIRSYRLGPLDCRGVLFRAKRTRHSLARLGGSLGWNGLFAYGLEIKQMDGDHVSMVKQHPYSLALAFEMSRVLRESARVRNSSTLTVEVS